MPEENLTEIVGLSPEEETAWTIDLGYRLTVYARGNYPLDSQPGNINQLVGFNELQHRIYGRIRHLRDGAKWEWTLSNFVRGLYESAEHYRIEWDLNAAMRASTAIRRASGRVQ